MDTAPLSLFAQKVSASSRLLFADLRRLKRDVLPDGITTRAEAEILLSLDRIPRLEPAWVPYLAEAVTAFVVSSTDAPSLEPVEVWLTEVLQAAQPKTAAAIIRALTRQGRQLNGDLLALVRLSSRRAADPGEAVSPTT